MICAEEEPDYDENLPVMDNMQEFKLASEPIKHLIWTNSELKIGMLIFEEENILFSVFQLEKPSLVFIGSCLPSHFLIFSCYYHNSSSILISCSVPNMKLK